MPSAPTTTGRGGAGVGGDGGGRGGGEPPKTRAFGSVQSLMMDVAEDVDVDDDDDDDDTQHKRKDDNVKTKPSSQSPAGAGTRPPLPRTWTERTHATARWLLAPIDGITLGLFRIALGYVLFLQGRKWSTLADDLYRSRGSLLPYPMFGWVPPPPPWLGHLEQHGLTFLPIFIALGYQTRTASALLFVCFAQLFIICESNHNNHYVLFCYALAMAPFTQMDANLSVDAVLHHRRHPRSAPRQVPRFNLFLWQIMFSIPYSFGAVAKINYDW